MPRLSLYRPEKGSDFKFLDRVINEQFQVGGTDVFVHKYLGPVNPAEGESTPTQPNNANFIEELGIQDVLLMENRDRHYEKDVYVIRGIYDMQDIDFNLSQFGLFLQNDTIFLMFHLRSSFEALGRKIMAGDVVELPHKKDEYALDDSMVALKRFYVIQDVIRPAKGYSQTWYPHLLRAKCVPLIDSQEFKEILDSDAGAGDGSSLRDLLSTYNKSIETNNQVIAQAIADAPLSGYNTDNLYAVSLDPTGAVDIATGANINDSVDSDTPGLDASVIINSPNRTMYVGYLSGDGVPPNGAPFGHGINFPSSPSTGEYYLRTDYLPNRLFRFDGARWVVFEDKVRMTMNNFGSQDVATGTFAGNEIRETQKKSFVNNTATNIIAGKVVPEKQALSKALRPKADN
jgi:hypothetical protein